MVYKSDFELDEIIYLDTATRSIPPKVAQQEKYLTSRDYQHGIFKTARDQSTLYLKSKELLAQYIEGDSDQIALVSNRSIAWNLILFALREKFESITTDWSEDSTILGPALNLFNVSYTGDESDRGSSILAYSSVDPLTGQIKNYSTDGFEMVLIDSSYQMSHSTIHDFDADIIIAELSIDCLAPFPVAMIYFKNKSIMEIIENPFVTTGNIKSFDDNSTQYRSDTVGFELGTVDINILSGLIASLQYLTGIGKDSILHHKIAFRDNLIEQLQGLDKVTILRHPDYESSHMGIISISVPFAVHDIALLLDEMENIEVRSGRICTHLSMEKFGIDGALRLSWHVYNELEEIDTIISTLRQVLLMFG